MKSKRLKVELARVLAGVARCDAHASERCGRALGHPGCHAFAGERGGFTLWHPKGGHFALYPRDPMVVAKLQSFRELQPGWDSYGAKRIRPAAIDEAIAFVREIVPMRLPTPDAAPLSSGAVQIEWETPALYLEVVFAGRKRRKRDAVTFLAFLNAALARSADVGFSGVIR